MNGPQQQNVEQCEASCDVITAEGLSHDKHRAVCHENCNRMDELTGPLPGTASFSSELFQFIWEEYCSGQKIRRVEGEVGQVGPGTAFSHDPTVFSTTHTQDSIKCRNDIIFRFFKIDLR